MKPFAGPVAILVDEGSYSASEIFSGGMQSIGRARVFGAHTAGGALPAVLERLPSGDVLQYAIGDFVTATGQRIEGRGVIPDQAVESSRSDLLAGRDPVLDAALDWIAKGPWSDDPSPTLCRPALASARWPRPRPWRARAGARTAAVSAALPPAEEILKKYRAAIGGEEAIRSHTVRSVSGTFEIPAQGMRGELVVLAAAPDMIRLTITLPGLGEMQRGFDGKVGWSVDPAIGPRLLEGASWTS